MSAFLKRRQPRPVLLQLLWLAGFVQVAIAFANLFLPAKLKYRENLSRVSPIIRQIFVVHSIYIVGVVLLFAGVTFGFAGELASGHGLGRFLAAAIALFWLFRAPVQLLYYDAALRKQNRWGDIAFLRASLRSKSKRFARARTFHVSRPALLPQLIEHQGHTDH